MSTVATLPIFSIEADGARISDLDAGCVDSITVTQRLSAPTLLEVSFSNPAKASLECGKSVQLAVGQDKQLLFSGEVTAVEHEYGPGGLKVRVRAYDRLAKLRSRYSVKAHVQMNVHDFAEEMTRDLNISVSGGSECPLWQRLIQYRQSDFDCLADLAERTGHFLTLRNDVLHLLTLEGDGTSTDLRLGQELLEASLQMNTNDVCDSTSVLGWDPSHLTVNQGDAISARVVAPNDDLVSTTNKTFAQETSPDGSHASALAQAELDFRVASKTSLWGLAEGNAELRAGSGIAVSGNLPALNGDYVLTEVTHTIDRELGYVTEFCTAVPSRRPRTTGFITVPGKVTRIDDPENLGRVCVSLTACNDLESNWMCILFPGAGKQKGCMVLPDVGDEVIACCSAENPAYGIVLGTVYGSQGMPDTGIDDGAVVRYTLLTPGGQRVTLDDKRKLARLENSNGSYLELLPDLVKLHAATDFTLEAPGRNVVIQGQAIDFRRA